MCRGNRRAAGNSCAEAAHRRLPRDSGREPREMVAREGGGGWRANHAPVRSGRGAAVPGDRFPVGPCGACAGGPLGQMSLAHALYTVVVMPGARQPGGTTQVLPNDGDRLENGLET